MSCDVLVQSNTKGRTITNEFKALLQSRYFHAKEKKALFFSEKEED